MAPRLHRWARTVVTGPGGRVASNDWVCGECGRREPGSASEPAPGGCGEPRQIPQAVVIKQAPIVLPVAPSPSSTPFSDDMSLDEIERMVKEAIAQPPSTEAVKVEESKPPPWYSLIEVD